MRNEQANRTGTLLATATGRQSGEHSQSIRMTASQSCNAGKSLAAMPALLSAFFNKKENDADLNDDHHRHSFDAHATCAVQAQYGSWAYNGPTRADKSMAMLDRGCLLHEDDPAKKSHNFRFLHLGAVAKMHQSIA